jgi:outer membrane protein assembly factor BamB
LIAGAILLALAGASPASAAAPLAQRIRDASGVRGGLVVHVGCGDGALTSELRFSDSYIVQGLDGDPRNVERTAARLRKDGKLGPISAMHWSGKTLPYVDNLVQLLIVDCPLPGMRAEILRVLCPGGVAVVRSKGNEDLLAGMAQPASKVADGYSMFVKPRTSEIDEWTHWMHDAGGNGVARDTVVGPPRHYQWTAQPYWSKHHDTVLTTSAMVSANGRVFYISNEEQPASIFSNDYQGNWFLVARDAFSGVLLWKRPVENWGWKTWGFQYHERFSQPSQLPSRLVAVGDRVYATLAFHQPVVALDAATGKTVREYGSDLVDEIVVHDGALIVSTYTRADLQTFQKSHVRAARTRNMKITPGPTIPKCIQRIDPETGKVVWRREGFTGLPTRHDSLQGYDRVYLTAHGDRVALISKEAIHCLDLADGKTRWSKPRPAHKLHGMNLGVTQSENSTLVNVGDVVLVVQPVGEKWGTFHTIPSDVVAMDARSGDELWKHRCGAWGWGSPADVFVIDGLVWMHHHDPGKGKWTGSAVPKAIQGKMRYHLFGVDLRTGQIKRKLPTADIFDLGHHHRCYRNKATQRFILSARRGTELVDLESGETWIQHWVRSECRFGAMPANGLLYSAPHPCGCYASVLLKGYHALAAGNSRPADMNEPIPNDRRLVRGPAFGTPAAGSATGWSTYRGDVGRSGYADTNIGGEPAKLWKTKLAGALTGLTVAGGTCYVASKDTHTVYALDAADGSVRWQYAAGSRVDSPPTIDGERVLFGSSDGWVTCLRASDGQLAWKFLAAPREMMMVSDSRLESVWPVHGSVLVLKGEVCFLAGRSSYLDGGMWAYRLEASTGKLLAGKRIHSNDPKTGKQPAGDPYVVDGSQSHILVSDGQSVYQLSNVIFGDGAFVKPYVTASAGLLDESLFVRNWWGMAGAGQAFSALLVHDAECAYGFRPYKSAGRTTLHTVGAGYELFCSPIQARGRTKIPAGPIYARSGAKRPKGVRDRWKISADVFVRGMVLTKDLLYVGGAPDEAGSKDPYGAFEGRKGGKLLVVSKADGDVKATILLASPPVWDGLAADGGRLYISSMDGSVVCLAPGAPRD